MNKKFKKVVATGLAVSSIVTGGMIVKNQVNKREKGPDHTYTIESGDTLYDISNRYYGSGDHYNEIAEYNGIENPDEIKAGDTIKIPNVEEQTSAFASAQDDMRATAEANSTLLSNARENAKELLENYVKTIGDAVGTSYTIEWIYIEDTNQ